MGKYEPRFPDDAKAFIARSLEPARPGNNHLTEAKLKDFKRATKLGTPKKVIAELIGNPWRTIQGWLKRGEDDELPATDLYRQLYLADMQAQFELAAKSLERLEADVDAKDSVTSVSTAKWLLERTADTFNLKSKSELSGPNGAPLATTMLTISPADLRLRASESEASLKALEQELEGTLVLAGGHDADGE